MTETKFPLPDFGFYHDPQIDGCRVTAEAIQSVLARLPTRNRWCVEFGAWDGLVGSTSRDLILDHGYSAVLIEGSAEKFSALKKNYADNDRVIPLNRFVGFSATDGLDAILTALPTPKDFDFLTVDIDGNDYHVWAAMEIFKPKVVMVEFNPTIPPEINFVQPADFAVNQGNSLAALIELGKRKNYELVSVLGVNAFFVRAEFFPAFGLADNSIGVLWTKRDCVTYFFTGYDGRVFLRGCGKLPWQESLPISEKKLQALPAFLQKYPFQRKHLWQHRLWTQPLATLVRLAKKLIGA
jgi:hypothetical protein